jgi:hypothetical protein
MTHGTSLQRKNNQPDTTPFNQPLSPREIRRQFLLDVLQEKEILFSFAICALGLIYSLLYAPVLGRSKVILIITVAAGLFGAASLIWRSVIRYQQGYTRKLQELAALYDAEQTLIIESRLQDTYTCLEQGFNEINSQGGLKILSGLEHEYRQLQPVIQHREEADLLSISNLAVLVRETYLQGLNVLEHALELERAAGFANSDQLQAEIKSLERKAAAVRQDPASTESLQLIQEKINFIKERLGTLANLHLRVEELLHQAERCEASLSKTHVDLADLKAGASGASVDAVIVTLQKTIERAIEVQAELKKMGY